jgi:acyl carrier protein
MSGENMDELSMSARLVSCFQAVFPALPVEAIPSATQDSLADWDSVSAITLISVIEDEFQVEVDLERMLEFTSFAAFLAYLKGQK